MNRPRRYERHTPYAFRDVPFAEDSGVRFIAAWTFAAVGSLTLAVWWVL